MERCMTTLEEISFRKKGKWILLMDALGDLRFCLRERGELLDVQHFRLQSPEEGLCLSVGEG
jgi:hypothetical protein